MSNDVNYMKAALEDAVETLKEKEGNVPDWKVRDYAMRLQLGLNILIQNERKIWIKTRLGKGMLENLKEAIEALIKVLNSGAEASEIEVALIEVEARAKEINNESRRRDMVVT
jgi:hypothetical protein